MFEKILIANRGEIACRVMRTARRLGIRSVAVFSDADRDALHVRAADEAVRIGPAPARDSYLSIPAVIEAARRSGAQAIHPGYGFLSENAAFADACAAAGLVFIGPPASAIRAMGGKSQAKALMEEAGVPLVPGYHGEAQEPELLAKEAARIGFPVLIKASAGGGGKGMKVARDAATFGEELASARREAAAAFGDDRVLIERYLEHPRHVEIQVFADSHGTCLYLFERDCSIQRRHQKVVEEAPAPDLPQEVRRAMGEAAVAAARAIGYVGAGTVEFLYDPRGASFFFMEMNTRLQVEHPVTEMITGLDLVEWQLRVAAGEKLPLRQGDLLPNGHAIEVRLYAEDPAHEFLPQTGTLRRLAFPAAGPHVRVDAGVAAGDAISIHYDPMIAKLIVWDRDRPAAVRRLRTALSELRVVGLATNAAFLKRIAGSDAFMQGDLDTRFIERHHDTLLAPAAEGGDAPILAALGLLLERRQGAQAAARASGDPQSPWGLADGWRIGGGGTETLTLKGAGGERVVAVAHRRHKVGEPPAFDLAVAGGGPAVTASGTLREDGVGLARLTARLATPLGERLVRADFDHDHGTVTLFDGHGEASRFLLPAQAGGEEAQERASGGVVSPMPGRVIALLAEPGAKVQARQPLVVIEAMKMEHTLRAPADGVVAACLCAVGDQVEEGRELVRMADADADTRPVEAS